MGGGQAERGKLKVVRIVQLNVLCAHNKFDSFKANANSDNKTHLWMVQDRTEVNTFSVKQTICTRYRKLPFLKLPTLNHVLNEIQNTK